MNDMHISAPIKRLVYSADPGQLVIKYNQADLDWFCKLLWSSWR